MFDAELSPERYWRGQDPRRWGKIINATICHHQNDSCVKVGSDWNHCFNVSLPVRDKVLRQCNEQKKTFEEKGEPKRNRTGVLVLTSLTNALPLGQTGSQCVHRGFKLNQFYILGVQVQRCFTSTETILGSIRDGEPRAATSTFTRHLNFDRRCSDRRSSVQFNVALRSQRLIRAQDGHLDFHTAPEL